MPPDEPTYICLPIVETDFHNVSPIAWLCFRGARRPVRIKRTKVNSANSDGCSRTIHQIAFRGDRNFDARRHHDNRVLPAVSFTPCNLDFERIGGISRDYPLNHINVKKLFGVWRLVRYIGGESRVIKTNDKKASITIAQSEDALDDLLDARCLSWINPTL